MNIVCCPLVSRELDKAVRCVMSCLFQFPTNELKFDIIPIVNSLDKTFVSEFSSWCRSQSIPYKITESHGSASKGKNEVLKFFRNSDYDGLCMLDGDDMWYPSAFKQIENHLTHHKSTDVIIVRPSDQIVSDVNRFENKINEKYSCSLWGTNLIQMNFKYGPSRHEIFSDGKYSASNLGGHVFYSRKLSGLITYDEEQILGEDFLLEFMMLKLHQERKIDFWTSFASDVQFLDRTSNLGVQQQKNASLGFKMFDRLRKKVSENLNLDRSSFNELPVEFPEIIFSFDQKLQWVKNIFVV